ncbi:MAG: response regulator, partial [Verrucomicrobiota bacterium]
QQAERTLTRKFDGSGLGLAICKGLVEIMGGEMSVESEMGQGARFAFCYQAVFDVTRECDEVKVEERVYDHSENGRFVALIAEDQDSNYFLLQEIFKKYDAELIRARDGRTAVECIESRDDVRLVLMDVQMPIMDGYEAAQRIAALRPEIPIIFQTASASKADMERALEVKGARFLTKPIQTDNLVSIVNEIVC